MRSLLVHQVHIKQKEDAISVLERDLHQMIKDTEIHRDKEDMHEAQEQVVILEEEVCRFN